MTSTSRTYFEDMYKGDPDPWGFASRGYERRKYDLTIASLPLAHYGSVYEPGCSIGVLTEKLAHRCDRLLGSDIIPAALRQAVTRTKQLPHVRVEYRPIPEAWPEEQFDLIVLSEIAYYFSPKRIGTNHEPRLEFDDNGRPRHWRSLARSDGLSLER